MYMHMYMCMCMCMSMCMCMCMFMFMFNVQCSMFMFNVHVHFHDVLHDCMRCYRDMAVTGSRRKGGWAPSRTRCCMRCCMHGERWQRRAST